MRILVLNGPNLNMLGVREPELYGNKSYPDLVKDIKQYAKKNNVKVDFYQSNYEGALVTRIQKAYNKYDGIVINPGAYTHTSVAILDALKAVGIKTVEVHLTNVNEREDYRKISFVSEYASLVVKGEGFNGYFKAIDFLLNN